MLFLVCEVMNNLNGDLFQYIATNMFTESCDESKFRSITDSHSQEFCFIIAHIIYGEVVTQATNWPTSLHHV